VIEHRQCSRQRHHGRRQDESDELVPIRGIADEARALLVLADCDQHGAGRRAVKAPEQVADGEADRRDHAVIRPVIFEVDAEHARARHSSEPALAAGELGPAIGNGEQQRGERQREQREVDSATAQNERARQRRRHRNEQDRKQRRQDDVAGKPVPLAERGRVGAEPEPGAVPERDESGIADENVQPHAGDGEDHHIDGRAQRQAHHIEHERQQGERQRGNDERRLLPAHLFKLLDPLAEQAARTQQQNEGHEQIHRRLAPRRVEIDGDPAHDADQ
jgi:hypothetical protein